MDIETVFTIIGMINKQNDSYEEEGHVLKYEWAYKDGANYALAELKEELQKYIDKQVAQMETEQGM